MTRWTEADLDAHRAKRQTYDKACDKDTPDPGPESELAKKICRWLDTNGYPYQYNRQTANAIGLLTPGWPDFTIMAPGGRAVWIELKAGKGRLSDEQKQLHLMAYQLGHDVHEVRSFKKFLEVING